MAATAIETFATLGGDVLQTPLPGGRSMSDAKTKAPFRGRPSCCAVTPERPAAQNCERKRTPKIDAGPRSRLYPGLTTSW